MEPIQFLESFFNFQKDITFDILKKLDFGIFGYSKSDDSLYWNSVLLNRIISIEELIIIRERMALPDDGLEGITLPSWLPFPSYELP